MINQKSLKLFGFVLLSSRIALSLPSSALRNGNSLKRSIASWRNQQFDYSGACSARAYHHWVLSSYSGVSNGLICSSGFNFDSASQVQQPSRNNSSVTVAKSKNMSTPAPKALSVNDPNSFSNAEQVRSEHLHLKWDVDFERKVVTGSVTFDLVAESGDAKEVTFDIRDLHIKEARSVDGDKLKFTEGETYMTMGKPLTVELPKLKQENGKYVTKVVVEYETDPASSALQWLAKEMTADKKFPFLFSHSEAIHARALMPCQDTPYVKASYTAEVTAPAEAIVLFSAVASGEPEDVGNGKMLHKWSQKVPIPSYLIAFAVGALKSRELGPRSKVWAESAFIDDAAFDFSETEQMIQAAESIGGPYVWGRYDILVLPPSFPFGGMENPCLTFATPTLLTHDKSLANVIAHEIAHSWTGNLVTNVNFEHFWLNEGFTVFLERKIIGKIRGENERQFASLEGWTTLEETVQTLGADSPMTKLVLDLRGVDPDDSFSSIPYEKGYAFLYYLETQIGGAEAMNGFLHQYVDKFKYKSINTFDFQKNFIEHFTAQGKADALKNIDWDYWFYTPGVPKIKPVYDTTLYDASKALADLWVSWDPSTKNTFSKNDFSRFSATQIQEFLQILIGSPAKISIDKLKAMEAVYGLNSFRNAEIRFRWLRLCIKAQWKDQLPIALQFVTDVGRMKFIRPIYRDLYAWEEVRSEAIATFKRNRPSMMYVSAYTVAKDLHLD